MSTCASRVALALLALGVLHVPVASSDEFTPEKYGIGAVLVRADSTSPIVVRRCVTGGPADQAGLLPGDHLLEVDGVSVKSWSFTKVLDYLIREAPLPLRITVLRGSAQRSFEIVRARFSDIAAGEGFRYVPSQDSLRYMIIPLEESAPLPVGSILKSVGLRNPRCHDAELPPYVKGHTLLYFWSSWCGPCKVLIRRLPAL